MKLDGYESLLLRREGRVLHVTMNRPESLNAIMDPMGGELERAFNDAALDDETAVVVLTGAGRAFSAGGDVGEMQVLVEEPDRFFRGLIEGKRLIHSMLDCPKPIVARVNGHAMGLGATLALFSDITVAATHAKIADPHVKVGFAAGDGGSVIWPQLIGYARAKEYLLTGEPITGEAAAKIGLINRAVPLEDLDRAVEEFTSKFASGAGRAIQYTKLSINVGLKQLVATVMEASFAYEALSNVSRDHAEAVKAFRDKRTPNFTGK